MQESDKEEFTPLDIYDVLAIPLSSEKKKYTFHPWSLRQLPHYTISTDSAQDFWAQTSGF